MRLTMAIATLTAAALLSGASFAGAADEKQGRGHEKGKGKGHARHEAEDDAAPSRDSKFRSWDKDGNGSISRSEYPGHPGNFRALDTNNDGGLTIDEFQHRAGAGAPEGSAGEPDATPAARDEDFRRLDADDDGAIARGEWRGRRSAFDTMDADGNGIVTREEYRRDLPRRRRDR